jgi:flagellar hook assembly protein FlgD
MKRALAVLPDPAPGSCVLSFSLATPRSGSLAVFDASGRLVRRLDAGSFAAGDHASPWDGRDGKGRTLPNGVYFARLRLDDGTQTRLIVLRR